MAVSRPVSELRPPPAEPVATDLAPVAQEIDQLLKAPMLSAGFEPAKAADDLTVLRRLSLSLLGRFPRWKRFAASRPTPRPDKLSVWTNILLSDPRYADYFAERLPLDGRDQAGQFIIYRRDRFWPGSRTV